jgi:hypothetical protein
MTCRSVLFTQTNALATVLGIIVPACVGHEIPIGTGTMQSAYSGPIVGVRGCAPADCARMELACSQGSATNVQCMPDPNAGQGSTPVGACTLTGDCMQDPANTADASVDALCAPDQCANQAIACVFADAGAGTPTNVRCVPDPSAGQGNAPADACILTADCVPNDAGH